MFDFGDALTTGAVIALAIVALCLYLTWHFIASAVETGVHKALCKYFDSFENVKTYYKSESEDKENALHL